MRTRLSANTCMLGVGLIMVVANGCSGTPSNPVGSDVGGIQSVGGSTTAGSQAGATATTAGYTSTGGAMPMGGTTGTGSIAVGGKSTTGGTKATGGASSSAGGATAGTTSSSTAHTCSSSSKPADGSVRKLTIGGVSREYILHVPSAYTGGAAVPLVIDFHPFGSSDSSWRSQSPYPKVIDKEGVISAYPNGEPSPTGGTMSGQAWNVGPCCVAPINGKPVDDVAFAKAIVQDIESIACIDSKRVYAVGFSMGGGMSHWLGCNAADVFAAVGPASFDLVQENQDQCHPSRPIPVMMWRGKQDTLVCYDGCNSPMVKDMTITFLGAVKCFQKWASLDGCTGNPSAADSNGCQTYSQCSGGAQVTLCTHATGSHEAADANIIWPMLKKFSLP